MRIKHRLIVYFSCVIILPVLISMLTGLRFIRQSLEHELDIRLQESLSGIGGHFAQQKQAMRSKLQAYHPAPVRTLILHRSLVTAFR